MSRAPAERAARQARRDLQLEGLVGLDGLA
jgi:hypothetical protein